MRIFLTYTTLILMTGWILNTARADDQQTAEKTQAEQEQKSTSSSFEKARPNAPSPLMAKLNDMIRDIRKDLDAINRRHFFLVYNNHNIITTVKTVQKDVTSAIQSCGKENPDMKDDLDARFATWNDAINTQLDEANGHIENMIIAQDYAQKSTIRNILKTADELREETASKVQKVPVVTEKACNHLLNKMDETQDTMVNLLKQTLVAMPQILEEMPAEDPNKESSEL